MMTHIMLQREMTGNKKVIAKKPLTHLHEMNSRMGTLYITNLSAIRNKRGQFGETLFYLHFLFEKFYCVITLYSWLMAD